MGKEPHVQHRPANEINDVSVAVSNEVSVKEEIYFVASIIIIKVRTLCYFDTVLFNCKRRF